MRCGSGLSRSRRALSSIPDGGDGLVRFSRWPTQQVGVMALVVSGGHASGELVAVECHAGKLYWFGTAEADGAVSAAGRTTSRPSS